MPSTLLKTIKGIALLVPLVLLPGCLLTVNHPRLAADGSLVFFLEEDGSYALFPETGVLHLLQDDELAAIPRATLGGAGGLLDLSPDGTEALYVDIRTGEPLASITSTLYRIALQPEAVPTAVWETTNAIARAVWVKDEWVFFLQFGEGALGTLLALDLRTGEIDRLAGDLLSFAALPDEEQLLLIAADEGTRTPLGTVIRFDPLTGRRETLAAFVLNDETVEFFATLPHDLLWDATRDGTWVALCLHDATFVDPPVESEIPDLYLIDTVTATAQRIASEALMPAFRPDGSGLVYAVEGKEGAGELIWHDLQSEYTTAIPGTTGLSTASWLSDARLVLTFEAGEDRYRLVDLDPTTKTFRALLHAPTDTGE
jgi:hypothetical protein